MMTISMMDIMTNIYFDYDDSVDYDGYPSVYGFVGSDDFELYHDLHGSDGCVVYCVSRGSVGVAVPRWCGDEGSDVYGGDVILPHTGLDESLQVLEHSVVGTIGVGLGRLRKLHGIRSIVDCFPDKIAPVTCLDIAPEFVPGPTSRPSDLMTRFGVLSAYRGFSVSFVQPLSRPTSSDPGK